MTMDSAAEVESLYRTVYQSEGTDISLIDKIPEKENAEEHLLNRILPRGNPRKTGIFRPQTSLHALLPGPDPDPDRRTARRFPGAGVADGEEDIEEAEEFVSRWMITLFLDARYADYIKSPASIYM